ncbi:MAG TPA: branched-chain amino acid ABC transporter substrate-binding protein [Candidatus Limnocylindrales bacterium]|nr:branched-chain amino acid ABC transporter substrate-binding protein [Candidatus Limnocylindrales bacterium]
MIAASAVLVFAACQPGAQPGGGKGTITIYSELPRQGSSKGQTDTIVNAIKLALEQRNNSVGGYSVNYVDGDDSTAEAGQWTEAQAIALATQAANDNSVVGYIGTFNSGAAKVVIPILCRVGIAMISPANTYPGLTKPGKGEPDEPDKYYKDCKDGKKNYHRVVPADDLQGLAGAKWAKQLGLTKVFVVDDSQIYGKGIADVFRKEGPGQGLEIVGNASILGTETDYKALAEQIKQSGAQLMYFGGITQQNAPQLWRDVKAANPDIAMMGPDGIFEQAFIDGAGEAAEGTYITFGGVPPDQLTGKGAEFVQQYKQKYNQELEAYTAYGYEAANVLLDAIERAAAKNPSDTVQLRAFTLDEVKATKDYQGVLGTWSFDENGDTTLTTMSGNQVTGGEFKFVTLIE